MPMLDVGWVAMDPMFADGFQVIRRKETVNQWGESTIQETSLGTKYGTVTLTGEEGHSNKDHRADDGTITTRRILVVTRAQLVGAGTSRQGDMIVWRGDRYTVTTVAPYPHYGAGFYQVAAQTQASQAGVL